MTIPREIRERLGLLPNTEVDFAVERGVAVLRSRRGASVQAQRIVGHLKEHGSKMRMSSKQLLRLLRNEPDDLDASVRTLRSRVTRY